MGVCLENSMISVMHYVLLYFFLFCCFILYLRFHFNVKFKMYCNNLADFLNAKTHKINSEINVNFGRKMTPNVRLPALR